MTLESFAGHSPQLHSPAFVSDCAALVGQVRLEADSSIWHHATLRADLAPIVIGPGSNIQDNACLHIDTDRGCYLGSHVTVGHGAILHACTIEDDCLIGMGAIVLDGAIIGRGSVVGAGAVVTKGSVIPPCSLVLGIPAKVVRDLGEASIAANHAHAAQYITLARQFAQRPPQS
ncbi:MAG: gamma carbonic anhydrase family protein [Akkermansiaceae bacterium]|nr:gamma carbonic anhydrase family protein [Akkermansiaceae bacterium]